MNKAIRSILLLSVTSCLGAIAHAETKTYTLSGMTCESCVKAVTGQVCKLPGIEKCHVEVNKMTLTGPQLDDKAISKAVEKTGFKLKSTEKAAQ